MNEQPVIVRTGFSGGQLFLAMLGGAAAGAAIAYLTAPQAGAKTRAQISDALRDGRDSIKDSLKDGREALREGRDRARQIPGAVKVAGVAARDAFVDAMEVSA